jgi:hypothetical protein
MAVYLRLLAPARKADEGCPSHGLPIEAANERPYLIRDDQDVGGFAGKTGFLSVSRGCRNA